MDHVLYISGTSRGLGKAIAEEALKTNKFRVIGISRSKSIEHPEYKHISLDLSVSEQVKDFYFEEHGGAKQLVLINNAATLGDISYMGQLDDNSIIKSQTLNFITPAVLMNKFIKAYGQRKCHKMVINISTGAAKNPYDGWSMYCSSKAALDMLSRVGAMEQEHNERAVRIISVAPGVVATNMQETIRKTESRQFSRKQKFVDLYNDNMLKDPAVIAKKYLDILLGNYFPEETISLIK